MNDETRDQAMRALAFLIATIRPDWPETSVLTILRQDRRSVGAITNIATHAAMDAKAKTPGVIATRTVCGNGDSDGSERRSEVPKWNAAAHNRAIAERCTDWAEQAHAARAAIRKDK